MNEEKRIIIGDNNYSLTRIEERCLNCGLCKKICKLNNNLADDGCIKCGKCILNCPSGALIPVYNYKKVLNYIKDTDKKVIVSVAPAVRVAIGDEFGFEPGTNLEKKVVGVLKEIGFDYVFDISFGADVTTIEEAKEFIKRLNNKENLPQFSSCCPSWVTYIKKYDKKYIKNLSTVKSPIEIQGTIINNYFLEYNDIKKDDIINVVIAPCVSKKTEIKKYNNNDFVLTTTELAMMIRELGIDLKKIKEKEFDKLLGTSSKDGVSFGQQTGVLTSIINTVYYILNRKLAPTNLIQYIDKDYYKYANINLEKMTIKVASVSGIVNFQKMKQIVNDFDFIEVMTCDGGCINGGGQTLIPKAKEQKYITSRTNSLKNNNHKSANSFQNEELKELYNSYLYEKKKKDLMD